MSQYLKNVVTCIVTIIVTFEAILKRFFVRINFKSQFQSNDLPEALKYVYKNCTCMWTHFSSIGSILVSITTILTSIITILASIEQVNTPYIVSRFNLNSFFGFDVESLWKSNNSSLIRHIWSHFQTYLYKMLQFQSVHCTTFHF